MSRRPRKNLEGNNEMNSTMVVTMGVIIIAIVAFVIAYTLYGNKLSKQAKMTNVEKVSSNRNSMMNVIQNGELEDTSSAIGKSVNSMQNEQTTNNEIEEKIAVNTSKNETKKENVTAKTNTSENKQVIEKNESSTDPTFIKPVDGDVIKDYATDNLVYSNTLEEWTTHLGIDYAAEKTSIVKASADGTVKSIKNDPRYGLTVVLEHANGFTSLYANLLSTEFITVGEKVTQGQTIATVGNTATFEIADETHLHFEILKDDVNVDPNLYIK